MNHSCFGVAATIAVSLGLPQIGAAQGWMSYGGNSQHTAMHAAASSVMQKILWSAPLDDQRSYYGSEVLIHYASPVITPSNTVVHSYRFTTPGPKYDNWRVIGRSGVSGRQIWALATDYSAPLVDPGGGNSNDWTSVYPLCLTGSNTVAAGAGGGTVLFRTSGDAVSSPVKRVSFYSAYDDYTQNPSSFANIKICTPLTGDSKGNVYFGYMVNGSVPGSVSAALGSGGVARVGSNGKVLFKNMSELAVDASRPALNSAPALSNDGKSLYVGVVGGSLHYLVKLDTTTFLKQASAPVMDPQANQGAGLIDQSSAAPMVGPDGHVFCGVFGYNYRESHGWLLQFDANLNPKNSKGQTWPAGAFGWDDTPSIVPANIVASYRGKATYLLLCKYNNYSLGSGDGKNRVAVLDPTSNSVTRDRQSGIPVMNEVITVLGPTPNVEEGGVCEWCINSAAIDVAKKSALINSEDGHCYRWNFTTNKLQEAVSLAPATGEAYTSTAIGPNGSGYFINNSILFAIGAGGGSSGPSGPLAFRTFRPRSKSD
ncbi:MAG TPA: hypothetical protein VG944_07335 [Fimbriimonas sp.]|nr:hypothetical protein [Fimbriimonas sp.]